MKRKRYADGGQVDLPEQDQQTLNDYLDPDKQRQAKLAAINKITDMSPNYNDPTMQNMLQGMAGGTTAPLEAGLLEKLESLKGSPGQLVQLQGKIDPNKWNKLRDLLGLTGPVQFKAAGGTVDDDDDIQSWHDPRTVALLQALQSQPTSEADPTSPPSIPTQNQWNDPDYIKQRALQAMQNPPPPPDVKGSVDADGYTHYAHGGLLKANSELEASRNPMKFITKNKNPSISRLRGIAFSKGGIVKK